MCTPQETAAAKFEEHQQNVNMNLTAEERRWASNLKVVVKDCKDIIESLSDFEYVQHALASSGDTEAALEGIKKTQDGREERSIQNTTQDALLVLNKFMDQHPGALLKIDHCGSKQGTGYFAVVDMSAVSLSDAHEDWKTIVGAFYYVSQCLFPNFDAMRVGSTHIIDFNGMELNDTSAASLSNLWADLGSHYPMTKFREAWLYNTTPKTGCALTELCKKVMKEDMIENIYLGCQMEVGGEICSLGDLFLQPTKREAKNLVLKEAERLLQERCTNEASFFL